MNKIYKSIRILKKGAALKLCTKSVTTSLIAPLSSLYIFLLQTFTFL